MSYVPFFSGGLAATTFWIFAFPSGIVIITSRRY